MLVYLDKIEYTYSGHGQPGEERREFNTWRERQNLLSGGIRDGEHPKWVSKY